MDQTLSLPIRVGLVGCGNISNAYFQHLAPYADIAVITACADIDLARAQAKAREHHVAKACSLAELLADPSIDAVLNLTIPAAHFEVNLQAIKAGKHVYCEKPLALNYADGLKTLKVAMQRNLRVGCAPDTVLGGGIQTCRRLIDQGVIGRPVAAVASLLSHGPEGWHPNPDFFYKLGGGPMFDMGPYYLTSLVTMLGAAKSVMASATVSFPERVVGSKARFGEKINVEVPTHLTGVIEFAQGAIATVSMSFDIWMHKQPMIEIFGTEGSISCPDPNCFGGEVQLWTVKKRDWQSVPLTHSDKIGRGTGLADMAEAIATNRPHRASGELGLHVLEIMEAFHTSSQAGHKVALKSTAAQPKPMPSGLAAGKIS